MTEASKVTIIVALIGLASTVIVKWLDLRSRPARTGDTPPAASDTAPSIAGSWTDKDGDALVIVPHGQGRFTISSWSFDGFVSAEGMAAASTVSYSYRTKTAQGRCEGAFAADGASIVLSCEEPGLRYAQTLKRAAA
jgi:hypothetical protein